MTNEFKRNPVGLLYWQARNVLKYGAMGAVAWIVIDPLGMTVLQLPVMPISIIGAGIGIFVSFRANQAYDRWWEGRKLWGRMINTSRHWGSQVIAYCRTTGASEVSELQRKLVSRHIAYVHALRCLLREQDPFADEEFLRWVEEDPDLRSESNLTHALLSRQLDDIAALNEKGELDNFRLQSMDESLRHLLDIQGGCERIKKTPMPRGYAFIAERLVFYFSVLFPFATVEALGWFVIPINLLVCMAFALISEAGRVLEDPFTMFFNGLPLSAISRMIEVNLRQRTGERKDLPPMLKPDARGILM